MARLVKERFSPSSRREPSEQYGQNCQAARATERRSPTRHVGIWSGRAGSETGAPVVLSRCSHPEGTAERARVIRALGCSGATTMSGPKTTRILRTHFYLVRPGLPGSCICPKKGVGYLVTSGSKHENADIKGFSAWVREFRRLYVMSAYSIIMLSIAALLAVWLFMRHWRRMLQRPPQGDCPAHGIDVAGIADRVQRVRGDFAAELHLRAHETWHRRGLLASARRAVGHLDYFRKRAAHASNQREHEIETHAA